MGEGGIRRKKVNKMEMSLEWKYSREVMEINGRRGEGAGRTEGERR